MIVKFSASLIFAAVLLSLSGCNATMTGAVGNVLTQAVNASMNGTGVVSTRSESLPIRSLSGLRRGYASGNMATQAMLDPGTQIDELAKGKQLRIAVEAQARAAYSVQAG